jgi:TPR repeat protein
MRKPLAPRNVPAPPADVVPPAVRWPGGSALALPFVATLLLGAFGLLPSVRRETPLLLAFLGASAALVAWNLILFVATRRHERALSFSVHFRPQHYVQACAQLSVYVYWGWYWRQVYDSAHLIVAQLVFAYAFDMLLTWSRRDHYTVGMGPFPIVFSINLFMWFKPDWFYLQFLMVATGFAAKEFIRWTRDGRRVHVFNPSSFPLGVVAVVLILTQATGLTWGSEIAATQVLPHHMYLLIFLVSLPAMLLFGVGLTTLSAVATTYACMLAYAGATGAAFFGPASAGGGSIPIAVFLGMHLLFTDPSTSPRTDTGRIVFGILYGLGVVAFFAVLQMNKIPEHYDKLLPVPILNVMVRWIDRKARSTSLPGFAPEPSRAPFGARYLTYAAAWAFLFWVTLASTAADISAARAGVRLSLGDVERAIVEYRGAVDREPDRAEFQTELGYQLLKANSAEEAILPLQRAVALRSDVARSHNGLGVAYFQTGRWSDAAAAFQRAIALQPVYPEAQFNLAQLHGSGRGVRKDDTEAARLYQLAAEHGNVGAQVNLGVMLHAGQGVPRNDEEAVHWYRRAAEQGHPFAQYNLAGMYAAGSGIAQDRRAAYMWYTVAVGRMGDDGLNAETKAQVLKARAILGEQLSPAEIAEATRLATAWTPTRR